MSEQTRSRVVRTIAVGYPDEWRAIETADPPAFEPAPGPLLRAPCTDELVIAYDAHGCPRALDARCPHRDVSLAEFARHGRRPGTIVCTAHRCEFEVASGACIASEVRDTVPALRSYRLVPGERGWLAEITGEDAPR